MCFSAGASFTGAVIISTVGVATVFRAETSSLKIFASIPLIFGIQQFSEGIIWVTLRSGGHESFQKAALIIYLISALMFWPVFLPFAMRSIEQEPQKRKLLMLFLIAGSIVAAYYAVCLLIFRTNPVIENHHIKYSGDFPKPLEIPVFLLYLLVTITPLFISSLKRTNIMGIIIFLSVVVSAIFYKEYLTSVWCFFAALISVVIFWIISGEKEKEADDVLFNPSY
jgi:Family of unknown function (DUF6629)